MVIDEAYNTAAIFDAAEALGNRLEVFLWFGLSKQKNIRDQFMVKLSKLFSFFRNRDPRSRSGESLLAEAASRGDIEAMRALLDRGVDPDTAMTLYPNGEYSDNSALYWAGHGGNIQVAEILLAYGANINKGQSTNEGPLSVAIGHGRLPMVEFLIKKGADVNQKFNNGAVPLHGAALKKDISYLKLLLENGALPNQIDNYNDTPLSYAMKRGLHANVDLLKRYGADEAVGKVSGDPRA